ncbi:MAG: Hsp20/alpha crystallin family protein [Anaerolineales bacterium]
MLYRIPTPSIFSELDRLQREMNRLFERTYAPRLRSAPSFPAMNVWTNDDGAIITAELPGVSPEDIDISIIGETLTLTGERKPDLLEEEVRYHRQERGYGKFTRSLELPFRVDAAQVEASFDKGVLHITLPRLEADKPKKIAIKVANE